MLQRTKHESTLVNDYGKCFYVTKHLTSLYKKSIFSYLDQVYHTKNLYVFVKQKLSFLFPEKLP